MIHTYLLDREVGGLPLSISTSMAIESCLGTIEGGNSASPPVAKYNGLWINIRTMFRNMTGAIPTDFRVQVPPTDYAMALQNEMDTIRAAVTQVTKGLTKVVFYLPSYKSLKRKFPHAQWTAVNTPRQIHDLHSETTTLELLRSQVTTEELIDIDVDLVDSGKTALVLTSYPVDLLSRYNFASMVLLESHTGSIKPPVLWYTKLRNGRELKVIPFDKMTLQVFGDNSLFKPVPIKIRRHLIDVGIKAKWTPNTTKAYVLKTIAAERDPVLETFIKERY